MEESPQPDSLRRTPQPGRFFPTSAGPGAANSAVGHGEAAVKGTAGTRVGVFDSGVGGFTVAAAILKRRPDLSLVYFADSLNLPYGGRSQAQLARFAHNSIEFLIGQGIDILAVGCNASNSALGQAELNAFGVPVFDLVASTTQWMRGQYGIPERIALIATEATIKAMYWERKLNDALPELQVVPVAAPEFVPLVEQGRQDDAAIRRSVRAVIAPLVADGINTILFGCTHYPLLQRYMLDIAPGLHFIDPAECLAEKLCGSLAAASEGAKPGRRNFYSSLPTERFFELGERVFGAPIRQETGMYIVNPWEEAC